MSLVEILISLLLLSCILFGLNSMELFALRENQAAYSLNAATEVVEAMSERLRAIDVHAGVADQIELWQREVETVLPHGKGTVVGVYPNYALTICWGIAMTDCLDEKITL